MDGRCEGRGGGCTGVDMEEKDVEDEEERKVKEESKEMSRKCQKG